MIAVLSKIPTQSNMGYERMVDVLRLRIDCAYDGSEFHGWACQPHLRTVQGVMENCLCRILHLDTEHPPIRLVVAGRTDTGVHASHQSCHLDVQEELLERAVGHMSLSPVAALEHRLRHILPSDIAIHRISVAPSGFDARFSALERVYVYRVSDSSTIYDPRIRNCVTRVEGHLNIEAMNAAMSNCIGLYDFGSFATPNEGGTTIREVKSVRWSRLSNTHPGENSVGVHHHAPIDSASEMSGAVTGTDQSINTQPTDESFSLESGGLIIMRIVADAFARSMVRSLVNASIQIGLGKRDEAWFINKLHHPLREGSTGPADASGLTLEHIAYPADELLAARAEHIRAKRALPDNYGEAHS